jgi:hypothetical protein
MTDHITFREIERPANASCAPVKADLASSLTRWYDAVRDKPLSDFSDEDLCRAVRQELHLGYVLPMAMARLSQQPLAGDMYDGELLVAVASIAVDVWQKHQHMAADMRRILAQIGVVTDDEHVIAALEKLRTELRV